jgi:WS/DGAT/MGAT family acyltransferase
MTVDTMSASDASFLHIEDGRTHMHIGSTAIFEGPPPTYDELMAMIGSKLPAVKRYRQRVRFGPLGLVRPVWVDDPHFNLSYHVRHSALPGDGDEPELQRLAARVMSQSLDRTKPLWEVWMVEGLRDDRWALVSKVHHCMVDGVASTDLLSVMLDDGATPPADRWRPAPEPSTLEVALAGLSAQAFDPRSAALAAFALVRAPRGSLAAAGEFARAGGSLARTLRPTSSSLTGSVGPHRRWAWARGSLADVKTIRRAHGGTVNDVVLNAVAAGLRELIDGRGERVEGRVVRTLVPVSVRSPGARGQYDNQVSAMFADLPIGVEDPIERLHLISAQMDGLKESKQAVAGERLTAMSGFAPPLLLALGARAIARSPQLNFETAATNVPGPQQPVWTMGRRLLEAFPFAPPAAAIQLVTSIFSYDGALNFGVAADYDGVPDVEVMASGIESGLDAMLSAAGA